jgi:hypothetical protein
LPFDPTGKPLEQERMRAGLQQRLRDVREGPDGLIYLLTNETAGAILRTRTGPVKTPAAVLAAPLEMDAGTPAFEWIGVLP